MHYRLLILVAISGCVGEVDGVGFSLQAAVSEEQVADDHFTVAVLDQPVVNTAADITWRGAMGEVRRFSADPEGVVVPQPNGLDGPPISNFSEWSEGHVDFDSCPSGTGTAVFARSFGSRRRGFVVRFRYEGDPTAGCVPVWSSTLPEEVFEKAVSASSHRFERIEVDSVALLDVPGSVLPQVRFF